MRFARHRASSPAPDMTPMVDVVFLLLIFFLTTTQMAQSARTAVELPHEEGEEGEAVRSALVVNVDVLGSFIVMDDAVSPDELRARAQDAALASPGAIPIVRADRRAPSARLNLVMQALREAGFESIRLATSPEGR